MDDLRRAVLGPPLLPATGAQNPIFGVNLSCEDPAEMDVSPSGYEPIENKKNPTISFGRH